MESHPSHSQNSKPSEKGMYEFFHDEFQSLRAKTGIRQWEQLNDQPDSAKVIHDHIQFMCKECDKPPFHVVDAKVKQRVISRAIVEDGDFIGLNAKFVRKALNAWWMVNRDRVMEALNDHKIADKIQLTPEQSRKIDEIANRYIAELLQGGGPRPVPEVENAEKQGAEWTSDIERRAIQYPKTTPEQAAAHELHLEYVRRNYDKYTAEKLSNWIPESEWLESLSQEEKNQITKR